MLLRIVLLEQGAYMVTCGTYLKQHHLNSPEKLTFFRDLLFTCAREFGWQLQAWAILSNHYHWIGVSPENPDSLRKFVSKLHQFKTDRVEVLDEFVTLIPTGESGVKPPHSK